MKQLLFRITQEGDTKISVNTHGAGTSCLDMTAEVEKRLGIVDESLREPTVDMYNAEKTTNETSVM